MLTIYIFICQVKKNQLPEHEEKLITLHTKMALNKIVTFQNELLMTQNELNATKDILTNNCNQLSKTCNELSTTRKELSITRNKLSTTRNELFITRKELQQTMNRLNHVEWEQIVVVGPERVEVDNPISIMKQLLQPSRPNTTQQIYATKIQHIFNSITIGEIQHINGNESFLKLHFPQIHRKLFISHRVYVTRNLWTIFKNDVIAVDDSGSYFLRLSSKKYDQNKSQCFILIYVTSEYFDSF